jgi:hypothetical protein
VTVSGSLRAESDAVAGSTSLHGRELETLRGAVLAAGKLEERIKWGHLVYSSNGPVLLIRAEEKRVLFGFWRGKRLRSLDDRLKASGKYEMATITLGEGDKVTAAEAKRLARAAIGLNRELGDPTDVAKTTPKRKSAPRRGRRASKSGALDESALREIALQFPDVADGTTARGVAFTARGRLLTCAAIHASAEPNSLVVRIGVEQRARLMAAHPDALYLTDHYAKHPAVLARLERLDRDQLRDILGAAWLFVTEKAVGGKRFGAKRGKR